MHERPTKDHREKDPEQVHSVSETCDPEGMASQRKRSGTLGEIRDSSNDSLPLEKETGAGGSRISQRDKIQTRSTGQGPGEGESEAEGYCDSSIPGTDAVEKKDELGLNGRNPGQTYSEEQKHRIIKSVRELKSDGIPTVVALKQLMVPRSTYYSWTVDLDVKPSKIPINSLLDTEYKSIVSAKTLEPDLSHRMISGLLRKQEIWVSPSSCYRTLKSLGLVSQWSLRDAPWKIAHYEPYRPNQIWGEDWTGFVINGLRHYLLTILDLFSRYVVAWGIVKTVTQKEIKNLVALALMSEAIHGSHPKPVLRTDPGSPNMAADVRIFLRETGVLFSPGRVARPTDNARQERFYRTLKQEEIYCHDGYISIESAERSLTDWIGYYNEARPHQALYGYSPGRVHREANKSALMAEYRKKVQDAVTNRISTRRQLKTEPTTFFSRTV